MFNIVPKLAFSCLTLVVAACLCLSLVSIVAVLLLF